MMFTTVFVAAFLGMFLCFVHEVTATLEGVCMGIQPNTNTIIYTKDSGETNPIEFYAATQNYLFTEEVGYRIGTFYWVQKGSTANSACVTQFNHNNEGLRGYPVSLADDFLDDESSSIFMLFASICPVVPSS